MTGVTGANGLLGSFIVRKLLLEGKHPVAIVRRNSDMSLLADVIEQVEIRYAEVQDPVAINEALKDLQFVIHAAAMVSFNSSRAKEIFNINVTGTRNVVNACLHTGVQRLVHISSVAALGRQKGQTLIDETNKWVDSPLNSNYAKSKYYAELEVFRGQEEGLSTITLNPSVILAPADWNKSSAQLFKYVWDQKRLYIDASLNYVDVRDVAEAAVQSISSLLQDQRFIISGGNIPFIKFFTKVSKEFGVRPPSIKVSKGFLSIAASFASITSRLTNSEPLITRETARLAGTNFLYDNTKAKKTFNLNFQTIDDTIKWCCAYYLENYNVKK